jgi:tetraacyldisaccharide-1-P 4'-kinase
VQTSEFPDHHRYDACDAQELEAVARGSGAKAFVTTEKDAQNLAGVQFTELPVFVAVIDFEIPQQEALLAAIHAAFQTRSAAA